MGTDSQLIEVLQMLRKSWDAREIPAPYDVGYATGRGEFAAVWAIYGNRSWKEVNPPDVSDGYACMTLMNTDVAKAYYTGTYMLRILKDYLYTGKYICDLAYSIEVVLYNIIGRGNLEKVFSKDQLSCLQQFYALPLPLLHEEYECVRERINTALLS